MTAIKVDQTTFDINATSLPGLQLAKPDGDPESESDIVMVDNVEIKVNGLVGIKQQSQAPILKRTEIATSQVPADTLEDAMEMDDEEETNGDDVYTDFDMDAPTDEEGSQKEIFVCPESEKTKEFPTREEKQLGSGKARIPDARYSRAPRQITSLEPLFQDVVAPDSLEKSAVVEEANVSTSVPEQGKRIEKLVDPAKVCQKTTLPAHPFLFLLHSFTLT